MPLRLDNTGTGVNCWNMVMYPVRPAQPAPRTAVAIFLFLSAIYLLFYTGNYYSIDEMAMFSMADSLLTGQGFAIEQLNWLQMRPTSAVRIGEYGLDGRLYAKVAPTQAVLAVPLLLLSQAIPALGAVKLVFLTNVWLSALNGVLLYALGRRLGYSERSSVVVALLYGLVTPALPYARTYFSEPLSGFCILASLYAIVRAGRQPHWLLAATAGLLLGVAGITRQINFLVVPFFGLLLFVQANPGIFRLDNGSLARMAGRVARRLWQLRGPVLAFVLPVLLAVLLTLLYNARRFANPAEAGYAPGETFRANPLLGLYVLFLSPGKSLFLYAPLFLLLPWLWWRFRWRNPAVAQTILLASLSYVGVLTLWYGISGGWAWGPRLLLPLMPLWSVLLLPLPPLLAHNRRWRTAGLLLLPLTLGIQLLGSIVDYAESLRRVAEQAPLVGEAFVFRARLAAHRHHLLMIRDGLLDLAWLPRPELAPVAEVDWAALLPLLLLVLLAAAVLWLVVARPRWRGSGPAVWLAVLATLLVSGTTVARYSRLRLFEAPAVQTLIGVLETESRPGDGLLSAAISHSQSLHNLYAGRMPLFGSVNDPLPNYTPAALEHLQAFAGRHQRLWLLLEWTPPGNPQSGLEQWLAAQAFRTAEWQQGGLRLILYEQGEMPPPAGQPIGVGESIEFRGYSVSPEPFIAGQTLPLTLAWQATAPVAQDYTVFIHLLDEAQQVVAQVDSQPWGGLRPTSSWTPGELILDRYALRLPAALPPGRYQLLAGLYAWPSLQRLPLESGGDALYLQEVEVRRPGFSQ